MLRILVADDHPLMRRGIANTLRDELAPVEVTEVADGAAALAAWRSAEWSLALVDVSMPGRQGLEVLEQLKAVHPSTPVLIVSALPEQQFGPRALRAGAAGFVAKQEAVEQLAAAVRRVLRGGRYVSPELAEALADTLTRDDGPEHEALSAREFDVFLRLARGQAVGEIARGLHLSVKTVSTYRSRIFAKMGIGTNADATLYAVRHALIEARATPVAPKRG